MSDLTEEQRAVRGRTPTGSSRTYGPCPPDRQTPPLGCGPPTMRAPIPPGVGWVLVMALLGKGLSTEGRSQNSQPLAAAQMLQHAIVMYRFSYIG